MLRLLTQRSVVLATIATLLLVGVVSASLGQYRLAVVTGVLLMGIAAVQSSRAAGRAISSGRRVEEAARAIERSGRRLERSARRLERRLREVQSTVRTTQRRSIEAYAAVDLMQRRYLHLAESERLETARRHAELVAKIAERTKDRSVVRELSELVRTEARQVEAMIQLAPRVGAQALLPSSGSYALDVRSLAHLVDLVSAKRPALVVELGSGTSTVYLGYLLAQWGGRLVSFDHDEYYAARTRAEVARHGLEGHVEVRLAPLAEQSIGGSDALWYDLTAFEGLDAVDVLLVDGPPGHVAPKVRQHALPALIERLSPGALVLLDDAPRPDEEEIARTWREEHGFEQLEAGVSRIAVLRLP